MTGPKPKIGLIGDLLPGITMPDLTEDAWLARDAEIMAARRETLAREKEAALNERRRLLEESGFPARALRHTGTTPATSAVAEWASASRGRNVLVLSGRAGCGKTVAAAQWALGRTRSTRLVRATEFAGSSRFDRETRELWLKAPALVLDDLGSEYVDSKGSLLTDLDELFDRFYGDEKPMIVTTNMKAHEFTARYGARIVDRLRECGKWVNCDGGSLRGKSEQK